MLERLEGSGVTTRSEQSEFMRDHFGEEIPVAVITEYVSRHRKGKHVPEGIVYREDFSSSSKKTDV